jgi:hypothetical protein
LQKSFHLSHADKIELKKISSPSENKKYATAQPDTTKTVKRSIDNGLQGRTTRTTGYNICAYYLNGELQATFNLNGETEVITAEYKVRCVVYEKL